VVWGMPDMAPTPAGPAAARPASRVVQPMPLPGPVNPAAAPAETVLAGQAGTPAQTTPPSRQPAPPMPAPAKPAPPAAAVTLLAGAAPEGAGGRAEQTSAAVPAALALLPAPAKPTSEGNAIETGPPTMAVADRPTRHQVSRPAAGSGIALTDGLVAIDVATSRDRDAALGSIPFRPESAMLTPDAVVLLAQFLNGAEAPAARIRIVGEAAAPALALDRARAVGLALVQGGVAADRLELTLAHGGSGDQARLFLAAPEL
jgi:outer membrane protein OmpA-like peptidoglycan-associated protein